MSKRKSRKPVKPGALPRGKRKFIIILGLSLCVLTTGVILAMVKPGASPTPAPAPQSQTNLAKEYIYAGGRLIATEEPPGGPTCSYSLSPTSGSFTSSGGTGSVNVSTQAGCSWNASSNVNWITITSGTPGSGNGTVNYSVSANGGAQRTGTLAIADKTFNVTQSGTTCNYSIDPTFQNFTSFGGTGAVSVFAPTGCAWIASSNAPWITITSGSPGSGNGTVTYSVASNTGSSSRFGDIDINGRIHSVTQSGTSGGCSYSISPPSQTFSASAGAGSVNVTTAAGCFWQAFTSTSWITVVPSTASGVGNGTVSYTITANTSSIQRIGTINIQGNMFTVTQNGTTGGGGGGNGLTGEYFNFNNSTNNGNPLCGTAALTRTDSVVNFDWGSGSPGAGVGIDYFLVRWTGQVEAPESGTYAFSVRTDDGVRLWVNNRLLINEWYDQYGNVWTGSIQLQAGQRYDIRMDMYERAGGAEAHLWWQRPFSSTLEVIPTSKLFTYNPPAQPLYEGRLEVANCSTISGWALNRRQINTALNVAIHVDGNPTPLATVAANQPRADLGFCSGESNLHGFTFTVPASLKDGLPHSITVKHSGTNVALWDTPVTLTCSGSGVPSTPNIVSATAVSATQIDIVWQDTSNNENGFIIQRSVDGGSYSDINTINSPNVTTFSNTGLSAGHTYCYKVVAFNNAGQSTPSNAACATIQGGSSGPPAAPNGLTGVFISTPTRKVDLAWADNSNNETSFQVLRRYRKPFSSLWSGYTSLGQLPANTISYSDTSLLSNNYTYGYVVRAWNDFGSSDPSNEVQILITSGSSATCSTVSAFSGIGGAGSYGYTEGVGSDARWRSPSAGATGIDPVSKLNALFVADTENHSIRMIYLEGPATGNSILIAGSGVAGYSDGSGDPYQARFNYPQGIAAIKNQSGVVQALLVADTDNHVMRRLLPPDGRNRWRVTLFSGAPGKAGYTDGEETQFNSPHGIGIGLNGLIYVADTFNNAVRILNSEGYSATWYSAQTTFQPVGIAVSEITGVVYLSNQSNHTICSLTTGGPVTLAGTGSAGYADGTGTAAAFNTPYNLAWGDSGSGELIYIADLNNSRVRVLTLKSKVVTTWAGSGASGFVNSTCSSSQFNLPSGVTLGPVDELYVIEKGNNSIRKIQ